MNNIIRFYGENVKEMLKQGSSEAQLAKQVVSEFKKDVRYKKVRNTALTIMSLIEMPYHGGTAHPLEFERYALILAKREDMPDWTLPLISLASVLHETGVFYSYKDHEFESVKMAQRLMSEAEYAADDIAFVSNLIFYGTRCFPQAPRNKAEQIMADADLANLGTDEFFRNGELLRKEQRVEDRLEWTNRQISFVGNHVFFTNAARELFDEQQKKNLGWLQSERNMLLGIA